MTSTETAVQSELPAQRSATDEAQRESPEPWATPIAWTPDVYWSATECCWVRHR